MFLSVSERIRRNFIRILYYRAIESKWKLSRYDSTRERIIYRLRNKDSND